MCMNSLFYRFGKNLISCFKPKYLVWHAIAIVSTCLIVISGFDWNYYIFFRNGTLYNILISAAAIGGLIPLLAPIVLWLLGTLRKSKLLMISGFALAQAAIIGSIISSFYKALTGRAHPQPFVTLSQDITHIFKFGFFRSGIFWGWPSSHTTIAFAMAFTLWALFPKNKTLKTIALIYALFIGIGVSMTIHWFSDFVAGAIIGTIIGTVVGRAFSKKL